MNIGIILLAAGSSSRMGKSKQLLLVKGEPLLTKTTRAAVESKADCVVVVLGSNFENHQTIIQDFAVDILCNDEWHKGMGNSLKKGLVHLQQLAKQVDAAIVLVCDQPYLKNETINNLITKYQSSKSKIIASYYSGAAGVPVLFDASLFNEIFMLPDEQGAKKIIQQHPDLLSTIDFPKGIVDLDTLEDYEEFLGCNTL